MLIGTKGTKGTLGAPGRNARDRAAAGRVALAVVLSAAAILALGLAGCESKPAAPVYDNAFDPLGPDGGDPLDIRCVVRDTTITVLWNQPQGYDLSYYLVAHSNSADAGFESIGNVLHADSGAPANFVYGRPEPTRDHYFRVTAYNSADDYVFASLITPGHAVIGPGLVMGDGSRKTPTRFVDLELTVSQGDSIRIAGTADFADAQVVAVGKALGGARTTWELGEADANGMKFRLYAQAYGGAWVSAVKADSITVDFTPEFRLSGGGATAATRLVSFEFDEAGVTAYRFAPTVAAVGDSALRPVSGTAPAWLLEDTLQDQTIYGQFHGDFGFDSPVAHLTIAGDPLTDASLTADVDGIAAGQIVRLLCDAVATEMRLGVAADFPSSTWQAYADTVYLDLGPNAGRTTVYAQFRNEFTDSPIVSTVFDAAASPLAIEFVAPTPGMHLTLGDRLLVSGSANDSSGAAIDSVKVHFPDGAGWVVAQGTASWSRLWDVPEVHSSVELTVRARAWAAGDSVTAQVVVVVDPPE